MSELQDLTSLVRANTALIVIETPDEPRVVDLFRHLLMNVWRPLYRWSITEGLRRIDLDGEDETALIPFDWLSDAKLVLTDALMKRGAAIRAARGEPEDDGLPEGEASDLTTDTTTPSEDNA